MNSVLNPETTQVAHRELLRFDHPDQWRARLGWREHLSLREHKLSHIVGGYHLGPDLHQNCGLCNTKHGRGYVVATAEHLETHIGKDCGKRHLGAEFEELERQFTAAMDAQDRRKRLQDLLTQRGEMLAAAHQAVDNCKRATEAVGAIKHRISREPTIAAVFQKALDADGAVMIDVRVSEDEYQITRERYRRELLARIDGHDAAKTSSPLFQIQAIVLPLISSLSEEVLSTLPDKKLAQRSSAANEATGILVDASNFAKLARRFTARRNWVSFASAFGPDLHKTNDRGRRILQQLVESGTD